METQLNDRLAFGGAMLEPFLQWAKGVVYPEDLYGSVILGQWAGENGYLIDNNDLADWARDNDFVYHDDLHDWATEHWYIHEDDMDQWAGENEYIHTDLMSDWAHGNNYVHEDDMYEWTVDNNYIYIDDLDEWARTNHYIHEDDFDIEALKYLFVSFPCSCSACITVSIILLSSTKILSSLIFRLLFYLF